MKDWDRGKSAAADRAERICNAARRAADKLQDCGLRHEAEDVRRVCRSNSSYRTTLRQLYLDNIALRQQLKDAGLEPQA